MSPRNLLFLLALLVPASARADVVMASWYGARHEGRTTANGCIFHAEGLTAASKTLPFGSVLRLRRGNRTVVVTITDRGPYVGHRDLDLSRAAAARLGMQSLGVAPVEMTIVGVRDLTCDRHHKPIQRAGLIPSPKGA